MGARERAARALVSWHAAALGAGGPFNNLLRAEPNTLCLACHDGQDWAPDVYGANIGAVRRHVYVRETGEIKPFVSGYSNKVIPNLWDRSAEMRAG